MTSRWYSKRQVLLCLLLGTGFYVLLPRLQYTTYNQLRQHGQGRIASSSTNRTSYAPQETWLNISIKNLPTDGVLEFHYHPPNNSSLVGWPFTIPVQMLRSLGLPPKSYVNMTPEVAKDFVFATGASARFVQMARSTVASIQHYHPKHKIRVYDLGMGAADIARVKSWCNVEYVKLDFSKYPRHVRNNQVYSWKPIIIMHALQTYSGVYWLDSSGRVTTSNFTDLLSQVQQTHGGLLLTSTGHATFPVTHEQMYKYLPISMEVVKEQEQREATLLFYRTKEMMTHVLPWLAFCALEERCIAPTKGRFCSFHSGAERNTHYANCHRFDQSAVNILMLNYLNSSSSKFYANQRTVKIERFSTNAFKEKKCPLPIKGTSTKSQ